MHDSAHTRECEDCAYQHALTNWPEPDEFVSPYQQAVTEMDVFPAESWLPLMSYRQAADAMGGAFLVTGPKVDRPESTDQHYIRVYELARACDLPSRAVIALLRLQDQYVADHLSLIARPAARDLLAALDIHDDLDVLIEKTRPLSIPEQFARAIA
jgi:hypothetical protein